MFRFKRSICGMNKYNRSRSGHGSTSQLYIVHWKDKGRDTMQAYSISYVVEKELLETFKKNMYI